VARQKLPRVQMNSRGASRLMTSAPIRADLLSRAEAIAERAGDGFEASVSYGRDRALASVRATTADAMRAEAKDRALTKAMDAGR
jgi:hypothetical protein